MTLTRKLSLGAFGLALVCFALPWVNISCAGQPIFGLTGIDLVAGGRVEMPAQFGGGRPHAENIEPEPLAKVVLTLVVLGCVIGLVKGRQAEQASAGVSLAALGCLIGLNLWMNQEIATKSQGAPVMVSFAWGGWLLILCLVTAFAANLRSLLAASGTILSVRQCHQSAM